MLHLEVEWGDLSHFSWIYFRYASKERIPKIIMYALRNLGFGVTENIF